MSTFFSCIFFMIKKSLFDNGTSNNIFDSNAEVFNAFSTEDLSYPL